MIGTVNTKAHTDIKRLVWVERFLPARFRPYAYLMRLDRPIGIWLLLLPSIWGIVHATPSFGTYALWKTVSLFCLGSVIMRGAGCVINDLWDKDLDRLVERTKHRPLASGIVSNRNAIAFLATLLLIGLCILLQFNGLTVFLGFLTIPLIVTYPLMKRITWWPQAFLGLTFNFGTLMGAAAITGTLTAPTILLYLAGIFWTLGYDTIYAHQDKEDDALAGIKSTALKFGVYSKQYVTLFFALTVICLLATLACTSGLRVSCLLAVLPAAHFIWQLRTWQPDDPASSLAIFKSNRLTGLLILASLIAYKY